MLVCVPEDEEEFSASDPSLTGAGIAPERPRQLVEYMSSLDHDEIDRLRDANPALIGNKHQVYGFLRKEDVRLVTLQQRKLAILSRMRGGRSDLNSFFDSEQVAFIAQREVFRSFEGYERGQVNRTEQVQYTYTQPIRRGAIDRFLSRVGARR
jgi:hypothetical protein